MGIICCATSSFYTRGICGSETTSGSPKVTCPGIFMFSSSPIYSVSDLCVSAHDLKKKKKVHGLLSDGVFIITANYI